MTTVAIVQPPYLPWLGFFDQMKRADVMVWYDDVQFVRKHWHHRNRIKGPRGPEWLSVPVAHIGGTQAINEAVLVPDGWQQRHIALIRDRYRGSAHAEPFISDLATLLAAEWTTLLGLNLAIIDMFREWFGIRTPMVRCSALAVPLHLDRTERPLAVCKRLGATTFLCGPTAKAYVDQTRFFEAGINVAWHDYAHPVYPQLHGDFVSHLSALDYLLNVGPEPMRRAA